jgi:hypothetical protein
MHNRGKLVVLTIFALAIAMASFALWWNWGLGHRSLDYWGENGSLLIRDAESVMLVKLQPGIPIPNAKDPPLPMESRDLSSAEKKDISRVKGLVHARHVFLEDASFDWNKRLSTWDEWQYAVLFEGKKGRIFVMLDLNNGVAGSSEHYQALRLNPKTASGWKQFVSRYFPADAPKPASAPAKSE